MQMSAWKFEKGIKKNTEVNLSEIRCEKTQFRHLPGRNDENYELCSVGCSVSKPELTCLMEIPVLVMKTKKTIKRNTMIIY